MSSAKRRGQWKRRADAAASLQKWAARVIRADDADWPGPTDDKRELFARMVQLRTTPLELTGADWNTLSWRIANGSEYTVWDPKWSLSDRLELVESIAVFLRSAVLHEEARSSGVYMTWDIVVGPGFEMRTTYSNSPGGDPNHIPIGSRKPFSMNFGTGSSTMSIADSPKDPDISGKLFDVLVEQLAQPDLWLQLGALHGLSHLRDPRTPQLIDRVRAELVNEDVRVHADQAAEFRLL